MMHIHANIPQMLWTNFDTVIEKTESLELQVGKDPYETRITNVVSTVNLLDRGEKLALETIATYLGGMAKFQKKRFAAIVLRIKDAVSTTTCLVFRSGKLVVVGAVSWFHALLACHMYRLYIEQVAAPYLDSVTKRIVLSDLKGRTKFEKWGIWNVVASTNSGVRPDLKALTEMLTDVTAWNPELFPGLKLLVWLTTKMKCKCIRRKKNGSCVCNARALIFDSGKVVMTGCKRMEDITLTRKRIQNLLSDEVFQDKAEPLPRNERFEARRRKLLEANQVEFSGFTRPPPLKKRGLEEEQREADEKLIVRKFKNKRTRLADLDEHLHPFVKACLWNQVENVAFMAEYDRTHVRKALEEMEKLAPEDRNGDIMTILMGK